MWLPRAVRPLTIQHPLRILAYVVHPVGVVLEWVLFRPFHWLGNQKGVRTLVGHKH